MTLYHFTAEHLLAGIKKRGLTLGAIPVTGSKFLRGFIWLTSSDAWAQAWDTRTMVRYSRTDVRITVEIRDIDPRLNRWLDVQDLSRIADMLNRYGDPENWFVYRGIIHPTQFTAIDYKPLASVLS